MRLRNALLIAGLIVAVLTVAALAAPVTTSPRQVRPRPIGPGLLGPHISSVTPGTLHPGGTARIIGAGFQSQTGKVALTTGPEHQVTGPDGNVITVSSETWSMSVKSWTDTAIDAVVPDIAGSKQVRVVVTTAAGKALRPSDEMWLLPADKGDLAVTRLAADLAFSKGGWDTVRISFRVENIGNTPMKQAMVTCYQDWGVIKYWIEDFEIAQHTDFAVFHQFQHKYYDQQVDNNIPLYRVMVGVAPPGGPQEVGKKDPMTPRHPQDSVRENDYMTVQRTERQIHQGLKPSPVSISKFTVTPVRKNYRRIGSLIEIEIYNRHAPTISNLRVVLFESTRTQLKEWTGITINGLGTRKFTCRDVKRPESPDAYYYLVTLSDTSGPGTRDAIIEAREEPDVFQ